jgi:hypothetical protein
MGTWHVIAWRLHIASGQSGGHDFTVAGFTDTHPATLARRPIVRARVKGARIFPRALYFV